MFSIPIRWQLPLLVGGLPLLVAGATLWVAYSEARASALEAAEERLEEALSTLNTRLTSQFRTAEDRVHDLAARAELAALLAAPSAPTHAAALGSLGGIRAGAGSTVLVQVLDQKGLPVPASIDSSVSRPPLAELQALTHGPDSAGVGAIRAIDDEFTYPIVAHIASAGVSLGYLVIWQRITAGSAEVAWIPQLVGAGTSFYIGSRAGPWTDRSGVVPAPGVNLDSLERVQRYRPPDEGARLAILAEVSRSPWLLALEVSEDSVLAAPRRFLRRMGVAAFLVGVIGLVAGLTLSQRILAPILAITDAAESLGTGQHHVRVGVTGDHEPARLAAAFNAMAERVGAEAGGRARAEEQWRLLFKENPHPMWVFDRETLRFLAVNEAAVDKYGYSAEEFLGMTVQEIRPAAEVGELHLELGPGQPDAPGPAAFRHQCKDGAHLTVEVRTRALSFDGRPARLVLAEDVTTRLALEAALRQSQKMEAVGRLAGGVAHDFNNFLTVIMTYVELAREGLPPSDPRSEDLAQVTEAAERAHALTRQLLAFTRQQVVQPVVLDPNEALKPVESMLRRLLGEDILIVFHRAPEVPRIRIDPGQFEQVLMNLAVNARDAMPTGGTFTVATSAADLEAESARLHGMREGGRFVVITVADNGTGMPPEVRARIFEPFFTTKEVGKGTGLGLATVYGIVAQAGGSISLYTEVGLGTTFRIYLPAEETDPSAPAATLPAEAPPRGTETILLVEDDAAVRSAAEAVLGRLGYTVLSASGAPEATAIMSRHAAEVHLVISDVVMPGTDGPSLLDGFRRDHPNLRTLLMSGYAGEVLASRNTMADGVAFLEKPFTVIGLAKKVREVLDQA